MPLFTRDSWRAYYEGKHVLITGASEGVGLELAKKLAPFGVRLSLLARTESKLRAAAAACAALLPPAAAGDAGRWVAVVPADVTDEAAVQAAVDNAVAAVGRPVDILFCCAGAAECGACSWERLACPGIISSCCRRSTVPNASNVAAANPQPHPLGPHPPIPPVFTSYPGYFHTSSTAAHRRMMDLNYMGVVHAVRAVLPGMVARRSGHLCSVASTLSLMGAIGYTAYAPSKFAVRGLMESLRNEVGRCRGPRGEWWGRGTGDEKRSGREAGRRRSQPVLLQTVVDGWPTSSQSHNQFCPAAPGHRGARLHLLPARHGHAGVRARGAEQGAGAGVGWGWGEGGAVLF
jgi:NAD(P)-dependent dehydrogenase (short-subunit alcohol dehydrogenase family)